MTMIRRLKMTIGVVVLVSCFQTTVLFDYVRSLLPYDVSPPPSQERELILWTPEDQDGGIDYDHNSGGGRGGHHRRRHHVPTTNTTIEHEYEPEEQDLSRAHEQDVGLIEDDGNATTSRLALNSGPNENNRSHFRPRRFSTQTQLNIDRGLNIINCWSAQRIASWIYDGQRNNDQRRRTWRRRGGRKEPIQKLIGGRYHGASSSSPTDRVRRNDTIFVSHWTLKEFVEDFLPLINVDVVIISTAFYMSYPKWVGPHYGRAITEHPHVLKWFTTDVANYTGGMQDHPKVSSFPLGLKPDRPGTNVDYRNPLQSYRTAFLRYHQNVTSTSTTITQQRHRRRKPIKIFAGPLGDTTPKRKDIPRTKEKMNYTEYLETLAASQYVLSPDGDHPDCYRHYEAIGLGTIPITQLDPKYYSHLDDGNIV
mmetsp:Transcript_60028/g.147547  ORF Transcript_60028/g.147547 Transcript_60028/m.147547 type:complete len:422 (-) Transcript_60028:408-1673(-)